MDRESRHAPLPQSHDPFRAARGESAWDSPEQRSRDCESRSYLLPPNNLLRPAPTAPPMPPPNPPPAAAALKLLGF